ncbi:hypothetical protein ABNQ38_33880 (plasmid) [Azospirillum sp. A29]|uniref:hypothetical protein n=1 Tax=Azospirillum sp. A29 TaxID=3160606 RepID=UPI00366C88C3
MNITLSNPPSRAQRRFLTIEGVPASTPEESLYAQHPSGTPTGGPGQVKWLITDPTRDAPTSRWRSYRETCVRLVERNPGNPLAAAYLEEAERVLTWRAALPEHLHFWRED